MQIDDARPRDRAKARAWRWASLAAIGFVGASLATIAWASERSANPISASTTVATTATTGPAPTTTNLASTPTESTAPSPGTTALTAGSLGGIAIVGDSLSVQSMSDEQSLLSQVGWGPIVIDAQHLRRIPSDSNTKPPYSGVAAVQAMREAGTDPHTWIVELGTNDVGTTGNNPLSMTKLINAMLDEIGPGHHVVWINIYQGQQPERSTTFNHVLAEFAQARADLSVGDWAGVAKHKGYLVDDQVHLTVSGARAFAAVMAQSVSPAGRQR